LIADVLTPEQMARLAGSESLEGFIKGLSETPYGVVSVEMVGDVSMALEKVFYLKFIERMARVVDISPRKIGEFLRAYYYLRFEVLNLKRILRGKFSGTPPTQILDSLVPIEPYQARSFRELAEANTLEEAVDRLEGTPYSGLSERIDLYRQYDELWPFELALNHTYASTILKSLVGLPWQNRTVVRRIVELETDVENVLIAMKQRGASGSELRGRRIEDLFPATYGIGIQKIRELIEARDVRQVILGLDPPFPEILAPIYEGDVALIRSRLRHQTYMAARAGRAVNDYGFNVIMAYLVFCEIEKDDLVGISWGKVHGIPSEDILKYLVIPKSR
jgi:V/A-type H+-transporting ATPase subunit C